MTADPSTPEGRAELRRLLDAANLGTLEADCCPAAAIVYDEHGISVFSDCCNDAVAEAAAAGMNALPALLDNFERVLDAGRVAMALADAEKYRADVAEAALERVRRVSSRYASARAQWDRIPHVSDDRAEGMNQAGEAVLRALDK